MIAETLLNYLETALNVPVFTEAPTQKTGYVLIDQTGSSRNNHIKSTTFAIQSYGERLIEAMELNEEVKEAMEDFITLDEINHVDFDTDYNFTDTTTKQYRWQAVFTITHY